MDNSHQIDFIKLHPNAILPCKSPIEGRDDPFTGDTGYDIFSVEDKLIPARGFAVVDAGIQVGYMSPGIWFRIEARSGLGFKNSINPHNGIIDNPYRGILTIKLYNLSDIDYHVKTGDKVCQLVIYPLITAKISWRDKPTETHRGQNRLGSSGR